MERRDLVAFGKIYAKVSLARGEEPDAERMQLYFDQLKKFELQTIVSAMEWAMLSLYRFPLLADLITQIEGSDEDHAEKSWNALWRIPADMHQNHDMLLVADVVMAKTITQTWPSVWNLTRALRSANEIDRASMKKAWRIAYVENYKNRDKLRREMLSPAPIPYLGYRETSEPLEDVLQRVFTIGDDYFVIQTDKRILVKAKKRLPRGHIPDDVKARLDLWREEMDAKKAMKHEPAKPKSQPVDLDKVRRATAMYRRDRDRLNDVDGNATTDLPDAGDSGDEADGNAVSDTIGSRAPADQ